MPIRVALGIVIVVLGLWPGFIRAGSLDELMTAQPGFRPLQGEVEVSADTMTRVIDLFGFRKDAGVDDSIGDYSGGHIKGGLALTRRLWVEGAIWKRGIKTPYDSGESIALQGAAQFQLTLAKGNFPALALRVSGWRDHAKEALKGSPTTISAMGVSLTADRVKVEGPSDRQGQLDLIATWATPQNHSFSWFGGGGVSDVTFNNLYATIRGCEYVVGSSSTNNLNGRLVSGDNGQCDVIDFDINRDDNAFPGPKLDIAYSSTYFQTGFNYQWFNEVWRTRVGYRFMTLDRDVDAAVARTGKMVYDTNHFVTGELGYRPFSRIGFFVRGQMMRNQFVGDVPLAYNRFSAHKFNDPYGILSVGIMGGW
ncbi:MAG: hypothetical protein HQL59_07750 [Magnetococcales bacterium]|nr:hypothetical protein [Magnetococcales bacterium]